MAVTPGDILKYEFLEELGLSQNQLGRDINVPARHINMIVKGSRKISALMALKLGKYFGTTPQFWMNLQIQYDLKMAKKNEWSIERKRVHTYEELHAAHA